MPVVLTIGARDIRLVAARENRITKWEQVPLTPGLVEDGSIRQPRELARVIDSTFSSLKLARDRVIVGVEGLSYTYRTLELPRLRAPLMEEAIERAARKEIPLPLEELYLDWAITGGTGEEVEVFIVGAPRILVDAVVETMKLARVNISTLGLKSLALARAAAKTEAIIVDFEPDCFEITIVSAGVPPLLHTVTPRGDRSNMEDNTTQLIDELNRTIDFHSITHPNKPIAGDSPLLLSGSLVQKESVPGNISQGTGHPVEPLTVPWQLPDELPVAVFGGTIGLISQKAASKKARRQESDTIFDIDINLLNGRRRALTRRTAGKRNLRPILLAMFFILLLIPLYLTRNGAVAETTFLRNDLERLNNNLRLARILADAYSQTETSIQKLEAETSSLQQGYRLISGRRDTAGIVEFMAYTLPNLAKFTDIDVSTQEASIDGEAATRADVMNYVIQMEKFSKFASVRIAFMEDKISEDGKNTNVSFIIKIQR